VTPKYRIRVDISLTLWDNPDREMLYKAARRALERVRGIGQGGCWEWAGPRNKEGYGTQKCKGRKWLLHRLIWTVLVGPLQKGEGRAARQDRAAAHPHFPMS
jgi:hypothetical protein